MDNVELVLKRFRRGEFDLVSAGRAVLGDPEWGRKAIAGEVALPFDPKTLNKLI